MDACPHCGAPRVMAWNAGQLVWICANELAGLGNHPVTMTTNRTSR